MDAAIWSDKNHKIYTLVNMSQSTFITGHATNLRIEHTQKISKISIVLIVIPCRLKPHFIWNNSQLHSHGNVSELEQKLVWLLLIWLPPRRVSTKQTRLYTVVIQRLPIALHWAAKADDAIWDYCRFRSTAPSYPGGKDSGKYGFFILVACLIQAELPRQ